MNDIIIIGAGVAGLTAAIYAARAGKKVLVLESKVAGGQIVQAHDVRNWPGAQSISGEELTKNIYQQAKALGAKFEFTGVTAVAREDAGFKVTTDEAEDEADGDGCAGMGGEANGEAEAEGIYQAKTLIIATGSQDRPLGLPEEEKYLNHGLSYCVTCDGALFKDKDVAVVGGGNTAFYDVLYLANIARRVYLIHRSEKFRADATLVERVRKLENVQILMHWIVKALNGEQNLESVTLQLTPEAQGGDKKPPETWTEKVSGLFVAIGREPATQVFRGLVKMDAEGYIVADEDGATSEPGVFAAGDCRTKKVRQLVTAAADGANAATAAVNYLNRER